MAFLTALRRYFRHQAPATYCCVLSAGIGLMLGTAAPRVSQVQVSRRFLLAVLHGQDKQAYALLAPEAAQALPWAQFKAAVRPLHEQGRRFGPAISLYKLGIRISEGQQARRFYDFSFKSDSLRVRPQVLLDVTFQDSTTTRILGFGLIPAPQKSK